MGKFLAMVVVSVCVWALSQQTVDLNLRQLQYVADHLTVKECRRLITALYQMSFQLKESEMAPVKGRKPCLLRLTDWNKRGGEESTVEDLTVRLHQIGRTDVARDIAQAVYGETAREIHKYFLDNPFKETANQPNSRLMEDEDEEEEKTKRMRAVDYIRNAKVQRRFALAAVTLTLTSTCIIFAVVRVYCPGSCSTMCPERLVATYQAMQESVKESVETLKSLISVKLLGVNEAPHVRRPAPTDPISREEQDRLVQNIMNLKMDHA
ncbi:hypothetical protein ACOMHN_035653 [Nucella lapillus]